MSVYATQFTCKNKKCGSQITIPMKLVVKDNNVVAVTRCSKCHDLYKFTLPMREKEQWLPLLGKAYFQCDDCGTPNEDNWKFIGDSMSVNAPFVKTISKCKRCGKERAKIVSRNIWDGVAAQLKPPTAAAPAPAAPAPAPAPAPPPPPPTPTPAAAYVAPVYTAPVRYVAPPPPPAPTSVRCFSCGSPVPTSAKYCPKCKIELICDKCGTRIYPGAKYCQKCGDKVERLATQVPVPAPPPASAKTIACPSCQEQNSIDSAFCAVCGQELICDKCHRLLRENASFCSYCGDPVTKGKFSV